MFARDWLLRRLKSAPLNAFPFRSPRGPLQIFFNNSEDSCRSHNFAYMGLAQINLTRPIYTKKNFCLKQKFFGIIILLRRERDSNPRNSCPFTAFRVRPDRPLRHLSLNNWSLSECKYSYFFTKQTLLVKKISLHPLF